MHKTFGALASPNQHSRTNLPLKFLKLSRFQSHLTSEAALRLRRPALFPSSNPKLSRYQTSNFKIFNSNDSLLSLKLQQQQQLVTPRFPAHRSPDHSSRFARPQPQCPSSSGPSSRENTLEPSANAHGGILLFNFSARRFQDGCPLECSMRVLFWPFDSLIILATYKSSAGRPMSRETSACSYLPTPQPSFPR